MLRQMKRLALGTAAGLAAGAVVTWAIAGTGEPSWARNMRRRVRTLQKMKHRWTQALGM